MKNKKTIIVFSVILAIACLFFVKFRHSVWLGIDETKYKKVSDLTTITEPIWMSSDFALAIPFQHWFGIKSENYVVTAKIANEVEQRITLEYLIFENKENFGWSLIDSSKRDILVSEGDLERMTTIDFSNGLFLSLPMKNLILLEKGLEYVYFGEKEIITTDDIKEKESSNEWKSFR